jgi:hypothetical protein
MTDHDRPADEARADERLEGWFDGEIHRAERDLADRPLLPVLRRDARSRRVPLALAGGLAALIVTLVALPIVVAQLAAPTPSPDVLPSAADQSPAASVAPATPAVTHAVAGLPAVVDGRPVLDPLAALASSATRSDATPFLVGGWWQVSPGAICPSAPGATRGRPHRLAPDTLCGGFAGLAVRSGGSTLLVVVSRVPDGGPPEDELVVLRVHVNDPDAATCPPAQRSVCERAVVLDAVVWRQPRFADGIPSELGGEPVLRAGEAAKDGGAAGGPVLVGGWYLPTEGAFACPFIPSPSGMTMCPWRALTDRPGASHPALALSYPLRIGAWPAGPIVLRGELVRPPYACDSSDCGQMLVVESVVWSGDAITATAPLDIGTVVDRLRAVEPGLEVEVRDTRSTGCDPGWPEPTWTASGSSAVSEGVGERIGDVLVFPTTDAREAATGNFHFDGFSGPGPDGMSCRTMIDGLFGMRWVAVDNVLVEVRVVADETDADRAYVERVRVALGGG